MKDWFFDLTSYEHRALFEGTVYPWQALLKLKSYLDSHQNWGIHGKVSSGAFLENPESIFLGPGCIVEPGAYIKGPCILGHDCYVRHGAYLRGYIVAGYGCVLGHATEIKHSILLNEAHAAHFAYLGDSILGHRINLGAGTKCANLRLDKQEIVLVINEQKIHSGLKKLGAIIGDDVQLGCNTVTNPGTLIGHDTRCPPGVVLSGLVPPRSIVRSNCSYTI